MTSEPGSGSSFWFTLPVRLDLEESSPASGLASLDGVRALVVDDNDVNRAVLAEQLGRAGMIVELADGGATALDLLHRATVAGNPYPVAFFDFHMPGMDGEQLGRLVAADASLAGIRLVMLSSSAEAGDGARFAEAGFVAYLTKPVRPQMLLEVAAAVLRSHGPGSQPFVTRYTLAEGASATSGPSSGPFPDLAPPAGLGRALVVDDNRVNQVIAVSMLKKLGWRADVASNGREGIDMWERMPYAIVFMDCQMPEMDGYDATREIRRREAIGKSRVSIIALTASAMEEDRRRCLAAGMDDFLTKPLQARDISAALNRWVSAEVTSP